MKGKSRVNSVLFMIIILLFGGCSSSDDNNPSPVPDVRNKFVGSWNVNDENCGKGKYVVTISKDPSNSARVLVQNFAFSTANESDTAIVAASNIVMPKQHNSEGWTIEGIGNYTADETIIWEYKLVISGSQESCTATYVKGK
jgi:hypothetical protein